MAAVMIKANMLEIQSAAVVPEELNHSWTSGCKRAKVQLIQWLRFIGPTDGCKSEIPATFQCTRTETETE